MDALQFAVVSDLYNAGRTEDGREYHAEVFYVQAEDAKGNRWTHHASFPGCVAHWNEEDGFNYFEDVREQARAKAERLLARIVAAGGVINKDHWSEARPAYGSAAYQAYGQYDDWMEEQQERGA